MWNPFLHFFNFGLATQLSQTKKATPFQPYTYEIWQQGWGWSWSTQTPGFGPQYYTNWVWWHMLRIPTCEVKRQHRKIKTNMGYSRAYLITRHTPPPPQKNPQKLIASPAKTKGNPEQQMRKAVWKRTELLCQVWGKPNLSATCLSLLLWSQS